MAIKSGFVYAISNNRGQIKLGKTINIEQRKRSLQTGNVDKLKMLYTLHVSDIHKAERSLHALFAVYRKHGEWFELDKKGCELLKEVFDVTITTDARWNSMYHLGLRKERK